MDALVSHIRRRKSALVILLALGVAVLGGCAEQSPTGVVVPSTTANATSPSAATTGASTDSTSTSPLPHIGSRVITLPPAPQRRPASPETPSVSAQSLAYAKKLGGTSHEGETLYFVIGDSVSTEAEARAKLQKALPRFDTALYMIVQRSDNFEGMRTGWWVVVEAYRKASNARDGAAWDKRGFADCYVEKATVRTSDPIPVVEDLTPGL